MCSGKAEKIVFVVCMHVYVFFQKGGVFPQNVQFGENFRKLLALSAAHHFPSSNQSS